MTSIGNLNNYSFFKPLRKLNFNVKKKYDLISVIVKIEKV